MDFLNTNELPNLISAGPYVSQNTVKAMQPAGILIVEDHDGVRRMLSAAMKHHGFAVWLAANHGEAVNCYRTHSESISIALLDVQLPHRDGPEILANLREINPYLRACFMTGNAGRYDHQSLKSLGGLAVFQKPMLIRELASCLSEFLKP